MGFTAILGGTFNPLHMGHYEMLSALQRDDSIERIFIMPDRIPPHKVCDFLAEDSTRIEMCNIAAKSFSKAEVCLIEFERSGKSYSYDTVKLLKQKYPNLKFTFVCGGDMLVTLDKWYRYEELIKEIPFIAFRRADTDNRLFDECALKFKKMGLRLKIMEELITDISSTEIRSDFALAEKLLPPEIFSFLKEKGVYCE